MLESNHINIMTPIILASNSPRRRELLTLTALPFLVLPVSVDETPFPGEDPLNLCDPSGRVESGHRTGTC